MPWFGALVAGLLLALPAVASAETHFVRTTGNDANAAANGCTPVANACATIGAAVGAAATVDGDVIDIGPGDFTTPVPQVTKTLDFVGAGPGTPSTFNGGTDTRINATMGPQEALDLVKGGSVSNLRLQGANGGAFSEALRLAVDSPAETHNYAISNVIAIGGFDSGTAGAKPAVLATDAGAAGGTVNATISGHFQAGGIPAQLQIGPGVVAATGTNVSLTAQDSTLTQTSGGIMPASVQAGAALTLDHSVVPYTGNIEGVVSTGTGSELTVKRSDVRARELGVTANDLGPSGPPGLTRIIDSFLLARPTTAAPEIDAALFSFLNSGAGTLNVDVDGSTLAAIGPNVEAGLRAGAGTNMSQVNVSVSNSILRATDTAPVPDGSARDIQATAVGTTTVTADHSSYNSVSTGGGGTINVTPTGSGTNLTGDPLFSNELGFDLTLQPASPLIDRGLPGVSGPLDLTGNAREQEGDCDGTPEPDVGAYETAAASCPPQPETEAGDIAPPDTTLTKKPRDKTKKKTATFEFTSSEPGSTFQCVLDGKEAFRPCTSPTTVKVKKGKHRFMVQATDAAGNTDPTPATDAWKVKKKKK